MNKHLSLRSSSRVPHWFGTLLALFALGFPIDNRIWAFDGFTHEAVAVWQRRESVQSHRPGFDTWYAVAGRDAQGTLGWHARHPHGTTVQGAGAPVAPPFGAPPGGDDKNPHVGVAGSRAVAVWQHSDGVSAEAVQWSIWSSELNMDTGDWTDFSVLAQGTPSEEHFDPAVAVDTDSTLAVWVRRTNVAGLPRELVFAVRTNDGWSLPSPVGFTGGRASLPEVTFTSASAVAGSSFPRQAVAVWSDVGTAGLETPHKIFHAVFDGMSWNVPAEIATEVSVPAIPDVAFANYNAAEEMPFGAHGKFGLTADGLGKVYVIWSGGPEHFGECTPPIFSSCPQPSPSPGVVGAILSVETGTWTPMLNSQGTRNLALVPNSKNPDGVLTDATGQFVGAYDGPFAALEDFALIEDTVSTGNTFATGEPAYNSPLTDWRPTITALSPTEVVALNWALQGPVFLWNSPADIVWSVGELTAGSDPATERSNVFWSSPQPLTTPAFGEQNMFPEVASRFVSDLVIAPSLNLEPAVDTNPVDTAHTLTATVTAGGRPADSVTVNFRVTGANTASGSCLTGDTAPGQCEYTYTGTTVGTDTIAATATVNGLDLASSATNTFAAAGTNTGRMTGDALKSDAGNDVVYNFQLRCDPSAGSNKLRVGWRTSDGQHRQFRLEVVESNTCTDDPTIDPGEPAADFDKLEGEASGRLDGVSGATIRYMFKDAGEPGGGLDVVRLEVKSPIGDRVLFLEGSVDRGNHQAQPK